MHEDTFIQEIRAGGRVVALQRRRICLEVIAGPNQWLRHTSDADRIVVGSHSNCDLVLTDEKVSRQHCEVVVGDVGYRITDLGSTNGTFIDQMRIGEVTVNQRIDIRVGDSVVRIAPSEESVELRVSERTAFGELLGCSVAMRRVFDLMDKVAPTAATVLLLGESGTGKEVTARAIHAASPRAAAPFIVVDCGALSGGLIEGELFGYERGAFTGAVREHEGAFESATGGTIFLDEIGEMPLELQSRLLGVLQRKQVQRLGSVMMRDVDVRVIAATNRDLRREINRGRFREDLYFRLAVVSIELPALRDRPEDVPLYVEAFVTEWALAGVSFTIDAATVAQLTKQLWPGNVRELRNTLERAAAIGEVELSAEARHASTRMANEIDATIPYKVTKAALLKQFDRRYLEQLLALHQNNLTRAARAADIDRVHLLRLLDKYGMRPRKK